MQFLFLPFLLCAIFWSQFAGLCRAQTPTISQTIPTVRNPSPPEQFSGETFCAPFRFANTGATGYGPYVRLILPPGITFNNATFGAGALTTTNVGTIPASGFILDPVTSADAFVNATDTIFGAAGSTVVLLRYPVGSITTGGIILDATVCYTIGAAATIGTPLTIRSQGVYQFGNDATGVNGPIVGTVLTNSVVPILYIFSKLTSTSVEPGVCHTYPYNLNVNIAGGRSLTGTAGTPIIFQDVLPSNLQFVGLIGALPAGCVTTSLPSTVTPGGTLAISCVGTYAGTTGTIDMSVNFNAYVPDVLNEAICDRTTVTNPATFTPGVGAGASANDQVQTEVTHVNLTHTNNQGSTSPGSTILYTIAASISEYTAGISAAIITFVVPDGMSYNPASLQWAGAPVSAANVTITAGTGSGSVIAVNVHNQQGANISPCGSPALTYTADVLQNYVVGGGKVLGRDTLIHTSSIRYNLVEGATNCLDAASTRSVVINLNFNKMVDNAPPTGTGRNGSWWPGDTVRYRLTLNIPSRDLNNVVITDFLPLPIHVVTDIPTAFGAGQMLSFHPSSAWTTAPTVTRNSATNSLAFNFGNVTDNGTGNPVDIVILVSAPITTLPFADGLFHSNFMEVRSDNSSVDNPASNTLTTIQVAAPDFTVTKGVLATNNPRSTISPSASIIPTDGNITNVDANDTLRYRITIQNDGLAPGYDLRIQDQAPASLQNCALLAPNPVATGTGAPGTGTAFNFTGGFTGNSLTINIGSDSLRWAGAPVANSLMHVDYYCVVRPNVQAGQLFNNTVSVSWASARAQTTRFPTQTNVASGAVASPTLSKRVNVITPGYAAATNRVTIGEMVQYQLNFVVPEGNLNQATVFDVVDAGFAFVRIDSIISRNTSGGNNITASAGSFSAIASAVTISSIGVAATQIDRRMDLNFGNITNVDVDNLNDTIKIFYSVRLINDPINVNGRALSNNATVRWENPNSAGNFLTTNVRATNLTVAEAQTQVVKTMSPGSLLPGRNSFVTLSVTNPSSSPVPAYNVQITDQLPQGMIFVSGFSTSGNARLSAAYSNAGGTITARWDTILPGQTSVATFEIQASSGITPCVTLTNCASITWQSLTAAAAAALPPAFSSALGVPRTGDISNIGGAANTYLRSSCAPLRVIIDNSFDPVITGNNQACVGGRATMTIRQYNAQIVRYRWTGPGVPAGFNSNELIIDPVTAADTGTYYVFVELDGCTTDTSNFFRLQLRPTPPTPVISATPNPVCEGASLALSTTTVANGYQWSGPNGFSSNLQTPPVINPVALSNAGTYTLVTTNTFGCSSTAASVNITVRPRPVRPSIQNNVSICSNQNLILNTNATATQYRWISPNGRDTLTNTTTLTILPTNVNLYQAGVWTLAVRDVNGCESVPSLGATVVINQTPPKPVADNNGPICQGEDVLLSVSPFPNSFYEWFSNPALTNRIAASQNPVISNLTAVGSPYTYYVRTTSLNGCASDTASTRVIVRTVPAAVSPTQSSPCAGDTLRLQAGVTATLYSWSGPGGFYSNLQNPIIANADASNAGSYVITITDANGCSNVGAVQVPVRPRPNTPRIVFTSPLCVGNTLNLTANNYTGTNVTYTWGTPTGTSITGVPSLIVVSATVANTGRYSLRVNVDGCISLPDSVNIVVNPNPAAPVVAATPNPVCEGGSLQLSTTTNAPFYSWSGANGFSSNLANPTAISPVTTANAGTYSLFVRDANNCQSPATNVVVTVTPRPAQPAAANNSSICRGANLILSTSATGLTSYRWIAPNGQDTTVAANPLTILPSSRLYQNGNFTLIGINANGCASIPSTTSLVVINDIPAAPIATNGSPVCAGGAVKLNASNILNANYIWTNPSGQVVGTQQNIDVFPTVSGNYSVMAVVNGCSSTLAATAVTVNPSPAAPSVPANFTVCEGSSINFSTTTTAASYLWTGVNGFSSTQQNPLVTNNALLTDAGVYRLVVTNTNGCTSTASSVTVTVSPRPTAPTLSAVTPVCRGNNLVFSSGSTASVYMWIAPNGATTTTSVASLTVSPASALYQSGNWGLSVGNAAGCFSLASIPVNVQIADTIARPSAFNNGAICNGSAVQLSTALVSGASYQWYSDAALTQLVSTQQNPTVSNVTATQAYFVVLTNAAGCRSQAGSTTVTVRPAVAAPAIAAAPNPVCEGGSLQLSTSTIAASYMWSGANGFSSMQQTPSAINPITLADAGTYTLRIVDANGCTSALASVVVTVTAQPTTANLTAASPVCRGNNLVFSSGSTASVYMWIAPNGATTTTSVASLTVSPASALYQSGNWGLSVGNAAGCFSTVSVPTMVQISDTIARPSAFNNGAICNGSAVQLSTAFVSGASYQWYSDAALTQLVSTQQNPTVSNVTATQAYFVVLTNAAGCRSQAGSTTVTVRPAVAAPAIAAVPNPVCEGGSLQLSTSTVAASYMWSGANGFSSMQQTPSAINPVTLASAGTYTLRIVDANGCTSALASVNVTVNAAPSMPFISNNSAICTGQNLILSSTTVADSFRWTAPNGRDTVTRLSSLTITPANTNFYQSGNWVLRVRNTAGCYSVASANSPVVINNGGSAPIAINNSPVCLGSSVTLTTPNAANATYTWYSDAALTTVVATTATAVIPNITTTSTFYLVVGVSGCTSSPASTVVTTISQPAAPNVPANFAVCEGGIIQLNTTTVANAYNWTGVNGFVSTQQNPAAITPAMSIHGGVYRLITSNASGCQSAPAFVTVTVNASPSTPSLTTISPVCRGNNLVFNTSSTSAIYRWIAPNGQVTTTSVPSLTVSPASATYLSGDWMLSVTNAAGCFSLASLPVNVQIADTLARPSAFNNGAICNGSAVQLSTALVSGVSYQWYSDAALTQLVSTQQNPTVSNITATQAYFVVLTNAAGCRSQAGSTTVTVRPAVAAPAIAAAPNPVCEGGSLQLSTSTVAASYMWSGANGFSSMQQTPSAINPVTLADAGTYTLRIVDVNGCTSALASVNVTVTPSPATPALATNNTICRGQNISLTTTATATQYRWIAPNGLDTITTNRPITIAPSSPLYQAGNWMLAVRNASGCESQMSLPSTMTINEVPTTPAVFNNSPVCRNGVVQLSTAPVAGATYQWYRDAALTQLVSTQQNPIVNGITANTSFFLVVTSNGCASGVGSTNVTVSPVAPAPVVPANFAVCEGQNISLSTSTLANGYEWTGVNGFFSNRRNPITIQNAMLADAGEYRLVVYNGIGCASDTARVTVTVNSNPVPPVLSANAPICQNDTLRLSTTASATVYTWIAPNGATTTSSVPSLNLLPANALYMEGNWQLSVRNASGCSTNSNFEGVTINPRPSVSAFNTGAYCLGQDVQLTATFINAPSVQYRWYRDAARTQLLATSREFTVPNVLVSTRFYVEVSVQGCFSNLDSTLITILPRPTVTAGYLPNCTLDTLFLTSTVTGGTAPYTYWWNGVNNFTSHLQNPRILNSHFYNEGSYVVTVTDANGCEHRSTVEVDIYPKPATPTIQHNAPVCVGNVVTLYTQPYFGLAVDYFWTRPNGTVTVTQVPMLTLNNATFADTGLYSLRVRVDSCYSLPGQEIIRLYPRPATPNVPANRTVCQGDSIILNTGNTASTLNYYWTGSNGFQSNIPSPRIVNASPADSGRYYLFVENMYGCRSNDTSTYVSVNPSPSVRVISSNAPICFGDTLRITANQTCATTQWYNQFGTPITATSIVLPSTSPNYVGGNWYMICTDANGCTSRSNMLNIEIKARPDSPAVFNNSPICVGGTVQLSTAQMANTTYQWFSNAGLTNLVSTSANPTFTNISTDSTFYLVVTTNGCRSNAGSTRVRVRAVPAAPNVNPNLTVCAGQSIVLSTNTSAAQYFWTGSNGFNSTLMSPRVVNATAVDSGMYYLYVIDANGCRSRDTSLRVSVSPIPAAPVASSNSPVCDGQTINLFASAGIAGTTYQWTFVNNGSNVGSGQTLTRPSATPAMGGYYYVVPTLNGCVGAASNQVLVNVNQIPASNAFAGIDLALCNKQTTTLEASPAQGATGRWTTTSPSIIANPTQATTSVNNLPTGNSFYVWTLSNDACANFSSDTVQVSNTPVSNEAAFAGIDQTLCGTAPLTLSATAPSIATGRWTQTAAQAGTGVVITNPNSPTSSVTGLQQGNNYAFTWSLVNGNCGEISNDVVNVTVNVAPIDNAYAGQDISLCNVNVVNMSAAASTFGTGRWTTNSGALIVNPMNPNTTVANLPAGANMFIWTLSNGACMNYSRDTVMITNSSSSDVAEAGVNQVSCGQTTMNLSATTPSAGTGRWTQSASQAAQGIVILNPNSPTSQVTNLQAGGVYNFTWTLSNGTCINYSSDITTISISNTPTDNAFAGADVNLCGANTTSLQAAAPSVGIGQWTTNSSASIVNPNNPSTQISNLPIGANVFVWTLSNGTCLNYDNDTVVINVTNPSSDVANAGLDTSYCNAGILTLQGNSPSPAGGIGTWTQSAAQAGLGANITNPNNPNSPVTGLQGNRTYVFNWTFSNGGCVNYSRDSVVIRVDALPNSAAFAGNDTILCGGSQIQMNATLPLVGTGLWSFGAPAQGAIIVNPSLNTTQVVNLPVDTSRLVWTLTNGSCRDYAVDTVMIIRVQGSTDVASAGLDRAICGVDSASIVAATPTTSTGVWTQSAFQASQGVTISSPSSPQTSARGLVPGNAYTFRWTLSTLGCPNFSTDEVTITINTRPSEVAYAGNDLVLCNTNQTTITQANNPAFSTGVWSSASGAVIINPTQYDTRIVNVPVGVNEFYWTLSNGTCVNYSQDTLIINVINIVDTADAGLDISLCAIDSVVLRATNLSTSTGQWSQSPYQSGLGVVIESPNSNVTVIRGLQIDSSYNFRWTLSNGLCRDYDSDFIGVQVSRLPADVAYGGADFTICGVNGSNITATTPTLGAGVWTTNNPNIVIVNPTLPTTEVLNLGQGQNTLIWTLSNGSCRNYSRDTLQILVDRAPVANSNHFDVIYNSNIPPINVIANDSLTPQWTISLTSPASVGQAIDLADGRFQIVAPDVLATQTFIYQVCNPNCPASYCDTALVTVEIRGGLDCEVPNVFTPNGDGTNDALVIPCLQNFPNSTITIFNRWGDEVFSTNNYQNNWEGTYNGGFLPDGTYFYILQVNSNPVQNVQGFVELRR